MRLLISCLTLLLLGAPLSARAPNSEPTGSQRYIVSFAALSAVEQAKQAQPKAQRVSQELSKTLHIAIAKQQSLQVQEFAKVLKRTVAVHQRASYLSNMVSLDLSASEAAILRTESGVAAVEPDGLSYLHTDAGPLFVGAPAIWNPGVGTGTRGEGIVVGIVDSGINALHPSFADVAADGFNHSNPRGVRYGLCNSTASARCNDKLIGIYDFTDEGAKDGADLDGHGTHVSGIAVGNSFTGTINGPTVAFPLAVSGVAPRANLISYKACVKSETGPTSCPFSDTIAALDQAARDGVTVINYSIGGDPRDPWAALNSSGASDIKAMFNAREAGIVVVVSAGNEGPNPGTVQSPANAPWVLGVANLTHDRRFVNAVLPSAGSMVPASLQGVGITSALENRAVVLGEDFGSALCGRGEDLAIPPTGVSNPFPANTFSGQIVVCDRGTQARVAKGFNVRAAGAGGMILLNTAVEGESIVADAHFVPTVHLGFAQAAAVKAWVRAGGARASISGQSSVRVASAGNQLNSSSSRGPNTGGILKPDLSAPGSDILSADLSAGITPLTGTSMAAPHVAGAIALLKAANPSWDVQRLESAVRTSGTRAVVRSAGLIAGSHEAGSGTLNISNARASALYFPLPNASFRGTSNATAERVNLPSMRSDRCIPACSFARSVALIGAAGAGSWLARIEGPANLTSRITPSSFSLQGSAAQNLQIDFDTANPRLAGQLLSAQMILSKAGEVDVQLPISLAVPISASGAVPEEFVLQAPSSSGNASIELRDLSAFPAAAASLPAWSKLNVQSQTVTPDSTPSDPHDEPGRIFQLIEVPAGTPALYVTLNGASARDVDLYVGLDADRDGKTTNREIECQSAGPSTFERCVLTNPRAGSYWIIAQNNAGNLSGDLLTLEFAALSTGTNSAQRNAYASMAGQLPATFAFKVLLAWELGESNPNDRYIGQLALRTDAGSVAPAATTLVRLERGAGAEVRSVLRPGRVQRYALAANMPLNRIGVDVPSNAQSVTINATSSTAISLDWTLAQDAEPQLEQAQGVAVLSAISQAASNASFSLVSTLAAPILQPGKRYYFTLRSGVASSVSVNVSVLETSLASPLAAELYYNPKRSGHGLFVTRARDDAQVIWYTYDKNNQPTWYWFFPNGLFAANASSISTGPLLRYTWDGTRATAVEVGRATLTRTGVNQVSWSYTLMGESGSESMLMLDQSNCLSPGIGAGPAVPTDFTGAWYNPAESGWGASVHLREGAEFTGFFLYDALGEPRWVLASENRAISNVANAARVPIYQHEGFCPGCTFFANTRREIGSYQLRFDPISPTISVRGQIDLRAGFIAPLSGRFDRSAPFERLTGVKVCR